ncbi:juxtaposed with another zinc finger protein 1-like [Gigantopelta aegis]|uniref:juxtaposed with another zinc finger protein 1-like n=1 Tax=Gigantopelta aegis TaxID=1735272 RepID=UPI001B889C33|nr:juxtaposed with another zinc finger protein 1-like [Gigantopelta aegis]
MAVFLVNNCTFQGCGLTFTSLADLIQHIEETHIDSDPRLNEKREVQQPAAVALSYVLKFFTEAAKKDGGMVKKHIEPQSPALSLPCSTPTESEVDDEDIPTDDEDSVDSWAGSDEISPEFILSMMSNQHDRDGDKPYLCPVPGCKKRYKNVNGIKYHARHGHCGLNKGRIDASLVTKTLYATNPPEAKKSYKCFCNKSYKTLNGLRNHTAAHHPTELALNQITVPAQPVQFHTGVLPPGAIKTVAHKPTVEAFVLTTTAATAVSINAASMKHNSAADGSLKTVTVTTDKLNGTALTAKLTGSVQVISQAGSAISVAMTTNAVKVE